MTKPQNTKKHVRYANDNILESLRGVGGSVVKTTADSAVKIGGDVLGSLFGSMPKSGELFTKEAPQPEPERIPAVQPIHRPEMLRKPMPDFEQAKLKQEIAAVRSELKALSESIKNLHAEVAKAVDEVPVEPGIYHVNFFARLKSLLKLLREQIDDSRSWMILSSGRKKKMGYWGMYKKHGTSFGLSGERSIASQAG